ncbi:MAG: cryptochrome/photolyase family protein [Planctomycetes bacterium]|nr:cryptochrome/photolyase family protein [Planctomycetota bacterium]
MSHTALIYPHQLFANHPAVRGATQAVLVEDPLFFTQYRFHRQKLIYHRATMACYARELRQRGLAVRTVDAGQLRDSADIARWLSQWQVHSVRYVDPCDDWLGSRLIHGLATRGISAEVLDDPDFLTPHSVIREFVEGRQRFFFTEFYIAQRKRLQILLEPNGKPVGGQWSFDTANRRRLPKGIHIPAVTRPKASAEIRAARETVRRDFPQALGEETATGFPIDGESAALWLQTFVADRLPAFGDFEDAISSNHDILFHSALTPMLNVGLLRPQQIIDAVLAHKQKVPINSLEGFLRQVIGWREFVRLVYLTRGCQQRTRNFWGFTHDLPEAFYTGTTGIPPVDTVIRRVLQTGYCHHIERLMILGNFLLLCEVRPTAVYRWFMELFIDAYDWVMVPNVYGMSQHADGGLMTTKPYLSGSAYVLKMSNYAKGEWCRIWDALYWRFIDRHAHRFASNPRMAAIVSLKNRLGGKLTDHLRVADAYLQKLHAGELATGASPR